MAIRNVETNWSRPKITATLTLPTTCVLMKSCAHIDITTYSRYHDMNAMVAGTTNARNFLRSSPNSGDSCSST